jgi:hypothetical protein
LEEKTQVWKDQNIRFNSSLGFIKLCAGSNIIFTAIEKPPEVLTCRGELDFKY